MNFSIKQALAFGWTATKKHYALIFAVLVLSLLVNGALRFLSDAIEYSSSPFNNALFVSTMIGFIVIEVIFQIGIIKEALKIARGGGASLKKILTHYDLFWKVIGTQILSGLLIVAAALIFIAPLFSLAFVFDIQVLIPIGLILAFASSIFVALIFGFSRIVIIDKACTPIESLRISEDITRGVRGELILFFGLLLLVNLAGLLLLGLGLLVTIPVSFFAVLHVYNVLILSHKKEVLADIA